MPICNSGADKLLSSLAKNQPSIIFVDETDHHGKCALKHVFIHYFFYEILNSYSSSFIFFYRIKINLEASRRSSSPSLSSTSSHQWKTPELQSSILSVSPIHFAPSFSNARPPAIAAGAAATPMPVRNSPTKIFNP